MGFTRIVNTDFWTDSLVLDSFTPEDRYFFLYLLTNPHTRQAGIYKLPKRIAAFELGYSLETTGSLFERFEKKYHRIAYSQETQEVAIFNYLRFSVVKGGKPVNDCIAKDLSEVKDRRLIRLVYEKMQPVFTGSDKDSLRQIGELFRAIAESVPNPPAPPIDNDNDNDGIVVRFVNDSSHESSKPPKKPAKRAYGEFNNVLLTDEQLGKLQKNFSDWRQRIENLSEYIASRGKKYSDHYATILTWARKDGESRGIGQAALALDDRPFVN